MVGAILSTDMQAHFTLTSEFCRHAPTWYASLLLSDHALVSAVSVDMTRGMAWHSCLSGAVNKSAAVWRQCWHERQRGLALMTAASGTSVRVMVIAWHIAWTS